jgi:rhodanese-related sulfurtransferase
MKTHNSLFLTIAKAAKMRIKELSVHEVSQKINTDKNIYLIDVREDHEWQTGKLPNAIHLGKGIVERDIENTIPDLNTNIILYCSGGYRSAMVADSLQTMGYKNVASMEGGTSAWINAGFELEMVEK